MTPRKGNDVGYKRVSSIDQNGDRQLADIELDEVFDDKCSGKDSKRPGLTACLKYLRKGDRLHVHSIDRMARNLSDLQNLVEDLTGRGVEIHFHKESLTFKGGRDPMQKLLLQLMGAVAEFERSLIRERQMEGIRAAQKAGKRLGAKPKLLPDQIEEIKTRIKSGEQIKALAREFGVSRQTIYNSVGTQR